MEKMFTDMHWLQWSDSLLPIGTFAFSNTLEAAVQTGFVCTPLQLHQYIDVWVRQMATTDAVAALHAHRASLNGEMDVVEQADAHLTAVKLNHEMRQMSQRMGRKLCELAVCVAPDPRLNQWLEAVRSQRTPGNYSVSLALVFACGAMDEQRLFVTLCYGVANMMLGAALRCLRVSHIDTQRILAELSHLPELLYPQVAHMQLDEMGAFAPEADVMASLHEKGLMRLFMN